MPAAIAIPAIMGAVGVGGSIVNGVIGSHAAKSAGQIQAEAAAKAGQDVLNTTNDANAKIGSAADYSNKIVSGATGQAADDVIKAAGDAGRGVTQAAGDANDLLHPYMDAGSDAAGTLRTMLASGGDLNRSFTGDDFKSLDPGFDFRVKQAQQAIERSQAARGGGLGGGAAKELARYTSDYSSSEFGKAFDRFETNANDRFSRLSGVAGLGLNASERAGANSIDASKYEGDMNFNGEKTAGDYRVGGSEYVGNMNYDSATRQGNNSINAQKTASDYATGGAAARAAGVVGSANAVTGAISGGVKSVNGAISLWRSMSGNGGNGEQDSAPVSLRSMLKNPATAPYDPNGTTTNPDGSISVRRMARGRG